MNSMVYVCPTAYLSAQNSEAWHSDTFRPGFVPILRSDLLKFRDVLDKVVEQVNQQKSTSIYQNPDKDQKQGLEAEGSSRKGQSEAEVVSRGKFQELKQFLPISLEQQLKSISIGEMNGKLRQNELDPFVCELEHLTERRIGVPSAIECWSIVRGLDKFNLFVRCSNLDKLGKLVTYWTKLLEKWAETDESFSAKLHYEENTSRFLTDQGIRDIEVEDATLAEDAKSLSQLFQRLQEKGSELKEDVASIDYKVDVSTLSDLPRSSLDQLCKDIVHFRTRVLTIEKEKRVKEEYEENRRMGQHMMKVFEQIRKSTGAAKTADDDIEEEDVQDDAEDDWSLEKRNREKEELESDKKFAELLEHLSTKIEPRVQFLDRQIEREATYESTLEQERPLYLKELLHQAYSPYYDHRRSFRDEELQRDKEDRERSDHLPDLATQTHETENQEPESGKFKLEIRKPQDETSETASSTEDAFTTLLSKLRSTSVVPDIVTEFLGEPDDDMVDYIFNHIQEHRSKSALMEELKETFDEDAAQIVERIWTNLSGE